MTTDKSISHEEAKIAYRMSKVGYSVLDKDQCDIVDAYISQRQAREEELEAEIKRIRTAKYLVEWKSTKKEPHPLHEEFVAVYNNGSSNKMRVVDLKEPDPTITYWHPLSLIFITD